MKQLTNLKQYVYILIFSLIILACEKPGVDQGVINTTEDEFLSTTGNSDRILEDNDIKEIKPLFHMHFDANLSKAEVLKRFNKESKKYLKSHHKASTQWFYEILTLTGTQDKNGTDGKVRASVYFNTNRGVHEHENVRLANPGDDREGGWDMYLLDTAFPNYAVDWVEAESASISLKGKDGWFLKDFEVLAFYFYQNVPATNSTRILSSPNVWLDNHCKKCWDTYFTGNVGTDRLNF